MYKAIPVAEFFQADASINTGNSGGPMFNMAGEVIDIVSRVISKSGGSKGLGFVVTINTAKQLLLERRSIWSGLEGQLLSDELADLFNLPPKTVGFLVKTVAKGSPGEAMGIKGGRKMIERTVYGSETRCGSIPAGVSLRWIVLGGRPRDTGGQSSRIPRSPRGYATPADEL